MRANNEAFPLYIQVSAREVMQVPHLLLKGHVVVLAAGLVVFEADVRLWLRLGIVVCCPRDLVRLLRKRRMQIAVAPKGQYAFLGVLELGD